MMELSSTFKLLSVSFDNQKHWSHACHTKNKINSYTIGMHMGFELHIQVIKHITYWYPNIWALRIGLSTSDLEETTVGPEWQLKIISNNKKIIHYTLCFHTWKSRNKLNATASGFRQSKAQSERPASPPNPYVGFQLKDGMKRQAWLIVQLWVIKPCHKEW